MSKQAVVELAPSSMTPLGKEDSINSADEHVVFIGLMRGLIKEANVCPFCVSYGASS